MPALVEPRFGNVIIKLSTSRTQVCLLSVMSGLLSAMSAMPEVGQQRPRYGPKHASHSLTAAKKGAMHRVRSTIITTMQVSPVICRHGAGM